MSNHLPIKVKRSEDNSGWDFEWDEDALIAEANVRHSAPHRARLAFAWRSSNACRGIRRSAQCLLPFGLHSARAAVQMGSLTVSPHCHAHEITNSFSVGGNAAGRHAGGV